MSNLVIRKRRGTTSSMSTLVALPGEIFIDLTKSTLVVHDGTTAGGVPLAKEVHIHADGTTGTAGFISTADKIKLDALSIEGGIQNVLTDGTPVAAQNTANFSTDFTVVDNPGASRTEFSISSGFLNEISGNTIALIVALG